MVRREWYLLWALTIDEQEKVVSTPLRYIRNVRKVEKCPCWQEKQRQIVELLRETEGVVVLRAEECFSGALLSVLNAFSCFDTQVSTGKDKGSLLLRVRFRADEREYVLQKLRFLGRRVIVESPPEFRERMQKTAEDALARYGNPG